MSLLHNQVVEKPRNRFGSTFLHHYCYNAASKSSNFEQGNGARELAEDGST